MFGLLRLGSVLFFASVLAGCAGVGTHALPPRTTSPAAGAHVPVTIKIDVPKATATARTRRPGYISPATTQMTLDIQTGCPGACAEVSGYPTTVALTPTSGGCTSTLASTSCQLVIALAPGNYTATLSTADGSGNLLSTAQQIAFTIVAGQANTISLSLSGVPASIVAHLLSATTSNVLVEALDADGNIIVGPGAPTFLAAQNGGSTTLAIVQPTSTHPNTFYATPSAPGTATLQVTASYSGTNACTQPGAVCTANFAYTATQASQQLFVPNEAGNNVTILNPPFTGAPAATISVNAPYAVAFDSQGDLFVATYSNPGYVYEYAPPYTGSPLATISGLVFPDGLAVAPDGTLYIAEPYAGIARIAAPYTGTPVMIDTRGGRPTGMVFDPLGNLWVADLFGQDVREFAPPYTNGSTTYPIGTYAVDVGFDLNQNMFVLTGNDQIFEYAPPYATSTQTITAGLNGANGVALDPAGNLYVADQSIYEEAVAILAPPYTSAVTNTNAGAYGADALRMLTLFNVSLSPSP